MTLCFQPCVWSFCLCACSQLRLQVDTMARAGLLLFLLAVTCEDYSVESFWLAPGDLQGASSSGVWQNVKPSSCSILAPDSFARRHVTHDGCARRAGAAERCSSGCLGAAMAAVAESSEYLENKEALKKVGIFPPMIRKMLLKNMRNG